jgi:hypothetical protein
LPSASTSLNHTSHVMATADSRMAAREHARKNLR